jgi:hypothetical protein
MEEIDLKAYNRKITIDKWFMRWITFKAFTDRGNAWIDNIKHFARWGDVKEALLYGGVAKLSIPFLKDIPYWQIFIVFIGLGLINEVLNYLVGWIDFKYGLWEKQNEWNSKHKKNNPFNYEMKLTMKEICKKLGIEHKFTDL